MAEDTTVQSAGGEPLLDTSDVARFLGVTVDTVQRLCRERKIRFARMGRAYRFRRAWVDDYVESCGNR